MPHKKVKPQGFSVGPHLKEFAKGARVAHRCAEVFSLYNIRERGPVFWLGAILVYQTFRHELIDTGKHGFGTDFTAFLLVVIQK